MMQSRKPRYFKTIIVVNGEHYEAYKQAMGNEGVCVITIDSVEKLKELLHPDIAI